ncbi:hypothetical protein [Clostridium estertheticum]|uniref:hypothetical protein n=1 Tax=Clostridium estertheticum TaxID=238834 RepID=UPI001C0B297D|nr:hypothetical protein [Clostridium estertheticum]MBU3186510.1 hypothetical protein [Clostridium estertheticum]
MIKTKVVQKTSFICDKCLKTKIVETELEEYQGKYEEISEDTPDGFHEIEELHLLLCDGCLADIYKWVKSKEGNVNV